MRIAGAVAVLIMLTAAGAHAGGLVVQKIRGTVEVREGVSEVWKAARAGMELGPEASIRTGPNSSAILAAADRTIQVPPEAIIDVSDIRVLSQEDLLLKLAMEKVREAPPRKDDGSTEIPNAAVVHGTDAGGKGRMAENDIETGRHLLKGTRVLFENGYFSTCALKTMTVMRQYPSLKTFAPGWQAAEALEKAGLRGEALNAYIELAAATPEGKEQEQIRAKISTLRNPR